MDYVKFTFNNLFDYRIISEEILNIGCIKSIDKLQISLPYYMSSNQRIKQMTDRCNPLNIKFQVSLV